MIHAAKLKAMRVLFIDDDQLLRRSMGYYFRKKVSHFVALESAEQALCRLKKEIFDVVICDYRLPGIDGVKFFEILGKRAPPMKKMLVTAFSDRRLEEQVKKTGIHAFIRKPFDAMEIEKALARIWDTPEKNIAQKRYGFP